MRASDLPLSILIVGVGGADFRQMEVFLVSTICLGKYHQFLLLSTQKYILSV